MMFQEKKIREAICEISSLDVPTTCESNERTLNTMRILAHSPVYIQHLHTPELACGVVLLKTTHKGNHERINEADGAGAPANATASECNSESDLLLGKYRYSETKSTKNEELSPVQPSKIERKKDVKKYTDEEKEKWKQSKQKENHKKAEIARNWIEEDFKKNKKLRLPAICQCGRAIKGEMSKVYLTEEAKIYHDHIHCRSWACPVCAPKRAWKRTKEIEQAILNAEKLQYKQLFITFTIPHTAAQKTKTVLNHLNAAYHSFRNNKAVKKILRQYDFAGQIKSLDFTFTDNGTHAHLHTIYIFDTSETLEDLAREIYSVFFTCWNRAVKAETCRGISKKHGLNIEMIELSADDEEQAAQLAEYTAKVISLYTANPYKEKGSLTPFDLLVEGNDEYKKRFIDYYKGSKGIQRLVFSPSLKEKLGIQEAEIEKPEQVYIATVSSEVIDALRDEDIRLTFEKLIIYNQSDFAFDYLRTKTLNEKCLIFKNNYLIKQLDNIKTDPENIRELVYDEQIRILTEQTRE